MTMDLCERWRRRAEERGLGRHLKGEAPIAPLSPVLAILATDRVWKPLFTASTASHVPDLANGGLRDARAPNCESLKAARPPSRPRTAPRLPHHRLRSGLPAPR